MDDRLFHLVFDPRKPTYDIYVYICRYVCLLHVVHGASLQARYLRHVDMFASYVALYLLFL